MTSIARLDQETLISILSFADNTQAAPTCRSLRTASQELMKRVFSELAITRNDQVVQEQNSNIEESYRSLTETVQQMLPQATPIVAKRMRALVARVSALKDEAILGGWHLIHSEEMFKFFVQQHSEPAQLSGMRALIENMLVGGVIEDIACHQLAKLFQKTIRAAPQLRGGEGLKRLHEIQGESVAFSLEQTEKFLESSEQNPGSFSARRFIEQEKIVQRAELEKDVDMFTFWEEVMRQFGSLHIPVVVPPTTPHEIRAWLRVGAHSAVLSRITEFRVEGLRHLPPEIGRLRNLGRLRCHGVHPVHRLSTLPEELGSLRHLTYIDLRMNDFTALPPVIFQLRELRVLGLGANMLENLPNEMIQLNRLEIVQLWNNRFRAIPEILMHLPHLRSIGMRNQPNYLSNNAIDEIPSFLTRNRRKPTIDLLNNPIQVLPDSEFRHNESPISVAMRELSDVVHLDLTRENLTHIPFRLWFKEHCLLPFFSFANGDGSTDDCLKFWAQCVLNTPLFLINLTLYEVVEPLVTIGRDLLGYDRLVRIRD